MTTIIAEELITTLEQTITTEKTMTIDSIRPYLYLHNDPAGTFTFSIKKGATTLASSSLTMAQIKSTAGFNDNEYHHGFFRFSFTNPVVLHASTYVVELSASGYTYASGSWFGWVKEYEYITNNITTGSEPTTDYENPYSLQIWSYK